MTHSIQLSFLKEGQQGFEIDERYIIRPPKPEIAKDLGDPKGSNNPPANPSQLLNRKECEPAIAPEINAA